MKKIWTKFFQSKLLEFSFYLILLASSGVEISTYIFFFHVLYDQAFKYMHDDDKTEYATLSSSLWSYKSVLTNSSLVDTRLPQTIFYLMQQFDSQYFALTKIHFLNCPNEIKEKNIICLILPYKRSSLTAYETLRSSRNIPVLLYTTFYI